jgi:23S rRNA (adenine2503-C2)-methyltransferase
LKLLITEPAKTVVSGMEADELAELLAVLMTDAPLPPFRAKQIFSRIRAGVASFNEMTELPALLRTELDARFTLRTTRVLRRLPAPDGSVKLQLELADGGIIETVILEDGAGRKTACLSTQLGCPMGCIFCKTGSLGFSRNLSSAEIVEQFFHAQADAGGISNIVIMGMGEPLLNLTELRRALRLLTSCEFSHNEFSPFSLRRVTVSTCGIVSGILDLAENGPAFRLAVSLTTADETLRRRLMPGATPLCELKNALRVYQQKYGKRITLEAVMLGGVNMREADVRALCEFSSGLDVLVNLIPWNAIAGFDFEGEPLRAPRENELKKFAAAVHGAGLNVVTRRSKGGAISGACGQLGSILCR